MDAVVPARLPTGTLVKVQAKDGASLRQTSLYVHARPENPEQYIKFLIEVFDQGLRYAAANRPTLSPANPPRWNQVLSRWMFGTDDTQKAIVQYVDSFGDLRTLYNRDVKLAASKRVNAVQLAGGALTFRGRNTNIGDMPIRPLNLPVSMYFYPQFGSCLVESYTFRGFAENANFSITLWRIPLSSARAAQEISTYSFQSSVWVVTGHYMDPGKSRAAVLRPSTAQGAKKYQYRVTENLFAVEWESSDPAYHPDYGHDLQTEHVKTFLFEYTTEGVLRIRFETNMITVHQEFIPQTSETSPFGAFTMQDRTGCLPCFMGTGTVGYSQPLMRTGTPGLDGWLDHFWSGPNFSNMALFPWFNQVIGTTYARVVPPTYARWLSLSGTTPDGVAYNAIHVIDEPDVAGADAPYKPKDSFACHVFKCDVKTGKVDRYVNNEFHVKIESVWEALNINCPQDGVRFVRNVELIGPDTSLKFSSSNTLVDHLEYMPNGIVLYRARGPMKNSDGLVGYGVLECFQWGSDEKLTKAAVMATGVWRGETADTDGEKQKAAVARFTPSILSASKSAGAFTVAVLMFLGPLLILALIIFVIVILVKNGLHSQKMKPNYVSPRRTQNAAAAPAYSSIEDLGPSLPPLKEV